jgi:cyclase
MSFRRIIPCLDVDKGRVVKHVNFFDSAWDAGDPVALAQKYYHDGADEIVFLDITASSGNRDIMLEIVTRTAQSVFIPFTVGGGIRTLDDIKMVLRHGADKVSLNSAAVKNPRLISQAAEEVGSQAVVVAIDYKYNGNFCEVYINGGRQATGMELTSWALQAEKLGAGELLLTSMDRDGTRAGYDTATLSAISAAVGIPLIASGGCGSTKHLLEAFTLGKADAALAASLFHDGSHTINSVKEYLSENGVEIRS